MKLKVYENRQLEIIQTIGTQNENNVEKIELEVPEKYIDWNKKLVFVLENEVYWDFVQDETYLITKAISKNKEVGIYVWLTNNEEDFRSETKTLYFNNNVDAGEQITQEEEAEANRFIAYIEAEKQELEDLINEIQTKLDNGEFNGQDGADGKDGKDGQDGSNGYSPTIRTIETTDGYDLEITDIDGTRTITILNGKDGKNGLNGQDGKDGIDGKDGQDGAKGEKGDPGNPGATGNGIASIVKTNTSGLIDTYTITFTDGTTTSFQVTNGQNGQPGADGRDGTNGVDGQDGYTPIRGTDYWTATDIAAIESYCDDYIDANITQAIGGSY